jgi:hypothetical protein
VQATVGKKDGATAPAEKRLGPYLDAKFSLKFYYVKKDFSSYQNADTCMEY